MKTYSIKEAAKLTGVEPHVLRYWEEELDIKIKRNDMGHRYYEEQDIKILQKVKLLKDKGIQLKAIHDLVKKMYDIMDNREQVFEAMNNGEDPLKDYDFTEEIVKEATEISNVNDDGERVVDFKMAQFQTLMNKVVGNSIKENIKPITKAVTANVVEGVTKQIDVIIKEKEEREEERYKRLDITLREMQQARKEIAAADVKSGKKRLFRKKRKMS
ncbi:MAG: helix-turn-helix domain-containing protein [Coprococcus sp.]